ncbi:MAG: hypothetical protein U9Q81_15685 [Pseudomonadota bacterium]|nr:hypothetical protein [Pseudomonadota bacterium]
MVKREILAAATAAIFGLGSLTLTEGARADGIFDMMNPFEWFSDDDDDYRNYRYGRGSHWGRGGPYGWGGPWGYTRYERPQTIIVLPTDYGDQTESALPE